MRLWLIPMIYVGVSAVCGLTLPRLEQAYLGSLTLDLSVASAQAYLSAAASGMMALTGIIFALAFVVVQFSTVAYSPRLVLWLARDHLLFHSLGAFAATFMFALSTLAWIDRGGSGTVPLLSALLVAIMICVSMLLFAVLLQRLTGLQITSVLRFIGDKGRGAIRDMFDGPPDSKFGPDSGGGVSLGSTTQIVTYSGRPQTIARLDIDSLVERAFERGAVIEMVAAVGDTLLEGSVVLRVRGGKGSIAERDLMRSIHLAAQRTFEQDPKYPIRLLVDIALKALSPAVNDPTTAVQAMDQIEDLLRRLGRHDFDAGRARDANGMVRLIFPMPTWDDYLALAFDEIRQFGASSIQVMRRLRAALVALSEVVTMPERAEAVRRYLRHLEFAIEHSPLDPEDKIMARQEDRQGLGLSGPRSEK